MRILHMLMFVGVLSLILGGAHYYVFQRLMHYWHVEGAVRKSLAWAMVFMLLLTVLSLPFSRLVPHEIASLWAWVGFTWLGVMMFAVLACVVADVGMFIVAVATNEQTVDMQRRLMLRRSIGVAVIGVVGGLSVFSMRNALRPVAVKRIQVVMPRLPKDLHGITIAQLTDIHIGPTLDGAWLRKVVQHTNELGADIIVITGDVVDGSVEELRDHVAPLQELTAPHGVYFITGNHEFYSGVEEWIEHISKLGIRVLQNEGVRLYPRGQHASSLLLAGVHDYHSDRFEGYKQDIPQAMSARQNPQEFAVLLAHQPAAIHEAAAHGVDLQLSGHTHGGQIYPFNYAVYAQQPYVRGLHRYPDSHTHIYVSCGTGFWGPPMRLGTAAEITYIQLEAV
jgi:predicted MPP superfamily phosphohydrolase